MAYRVTWPGPTTNQISTQLQERLPGGTWSTISSTFSGQGSINLVRSPGIYEYRTRAVEEFFHNQYEPDIRFVFSSSISVTVYAGDPPVFDEIEDQMEYDWQARAGHINSDGILDVFIERTSGDLDNGIVSEAILLGRPGGTYARFTGTATQIATARSWPTINASFELGDYNLDEIGDLVVVDLPGNGMPHILLSAGRFFERNATHVIPMDNSRLLFFKDLAGWASDENHFDGADLGTVPGYNIKIITTVTACYSFYFFPVCYSYSYILAEINVSLEDLGLDDYLGLGYVAQAANGGSTGSGNLQKTAPNGVSAYSAATYIAPEVEAAAAPMVAELGIDRSLHGTPEEQEIALANVAGDLPQNPPPNTLVCVYWCTYQVLVGYNSYYVISWVDVWTPIMIDAGFDNENFSEEAFDVAGILDNIGMGEAAISDQDWAEVGQIFTTVLGATIAIPVPGDVPMPNDDAESKKKLGRWGRLMVALWAMMEAAEIANDIYADYRLLNHFTDQPGVGFIFESGLINPPSGQVFLTHLAYPVAVMAEQKLALCREVVGYFIVRQANTDAGPVGRVLPKVCRPDEPLAGTIQPGGGWEQVATAPVSALPFRFIPIPRNFSLPN